MGRSCSTVTVGQTPKLLICTKSQLRIKLGTLYNSYAKSLKLSLDDLNAQGVVIGVSTCLLETPPHNVSQLLGLRGSCEFVPVAIYERE